MRNNPERLMADDTKIRGSQDRSRVNMAEDYEVGYWTKKWGVSREQLAAAAEKAGPMAVDIARELGKQP